MVKLMFLSMILVLIVLVLNISKDGVTRNNSEEKRNTLQYLLDLPRLLLLQITTLKKFGLILLITKLSVTEWRLFAWIPNGKIELLLKRMLHNLS